MEIDRWEKDEAGDIRMLPLLGFSILIAAETAIGLRLEHDGDSEDSPSGALQLILTPAQASDLGGMLQKAAERVGEQTVRRIPS
ncbi:chemotaxis protein [Bradyrhizobium sp. AUGA SZCCT0169]|uniref:chemotaxis protein n=1 Tax=unclassified Bradyrhizobium TaxID=2631580 RepID=UPI001BA71B7D|nr:MULTISPECIES: chemotaxis protein [unclassified Bradyrhizobium]MBR1187308.1 chemotaxis protein [Bradyrhizobium sp. AUGA SZCCT0160]MBR1250068.1 chemotaxis protein [Bradyrhizobium sp. AUGA SZCCT0169]